MQTFPVVLSSALFWVRVVDHWHEDQIKRREESGRFSV